MLATSFIDISAGQLLIVKFSCYELADALINFGSVIDNGIAHVVCRRQVLWMAKQILQLGIGDAIDDWLLGKIQWLRKEEVVASGIHWVKGVRLQDALHSLPRCRKERDNSMKTFDVTGACSIISLGVSLVGNEANLLRADP